MRPYISPSLRLQPCLGRRTAWGEAAVWGSPYLQADLLMTLWLVSGA